MFVKHSILTFEKFINQPSGYNVDVIFGKKHYFEIFYLNVYNSCFIATFGPNIYKIL